MSYVGAMRQTLPVRARSPRRSHRGQAVRLTAGEAVPDRRSRTGVALGEAYRSEVGGDERAATWMARRVTDTDGRWTLEARATACTSRADRVAGELAHRRGRAPRRPAPGRARRRCRCPWRPATRIVPSPSNSHGTGRVPPTSTKSRSTASREGSPSGVAIHGSSRSSRRSSGHRRGRPGGACAAPRAPAGRTAAGRPAGSRCRAARPYQSSTSAMSTSPDCTSRIPRPDRLWPQPRVSSVWRRRERASAGANATAAVGKAVTTTRPDGRARVGRQVGLGLLDHGQDAFGVRHQAAPGVGELGAARGPVDQGRAGLAFQRRELLGDRRRTVARATRRSRRCCPGGRTRRSTPNAANRASDFLMPTHKKPRLS